MSKHFAMKCCGTGDKVPHIFKPQLQMEGNWENIIVKAQILQISKSSEILCSSHIIMLNR